MLNVSTTNRNQFLSCIGAKVRKSMGIGVAVDIPHGKYSAEMHEGFVVMVKDIPDGVTVERVLNRGGR